MTPTRREFIVQCAALGSGALALSLPAVAQTSLQELSPFSYAQCVATCPGFPAQRTQVLQECVALLEQIAGSKAHAVHRAGGAEGLMASLEFPGGARGEIVVQKQNALPSGLTIRGLDGVHFFPLA